MIPELLAPAGDPVALAAALDAGADAVYVGVKGLNMRAGARNFEISGLRKTADLVHSRGKRIYLALNTIIYQDELDKICGILDQAKSAGVDAVICWDLAVLREARIRGLEIHLSTQASVANATAASAFRDMGVSRIILARECTLEHVADMKKQTGVEIEVFGHGAMCVAYSGRCFTSQFLFGRSANRGECLQPCRREYKVIDPEEGHELVLDKGFIMSPKDLCTMPFLDKVVETGIDALKIEGRNRSPEYVSTVVSCYREGLDLIRKGMFDDAAKKVLLDRLKGVYNRGFSEGFFFGRPGNEAFTGSYGSVSQLRKRYVGKVVNFFDRISVALVKVESGGFRRGDALMFQGKTTGVVEQEACSLQVDHKEIDEATKGASVAIKIRSPVKPNDKVFVIEKISD